MHSSELSIITACSRLEHLPEIRTSIYRLLPGCEWVIILDTDKLVTLPPEFVRRIYLDNFITLKYTGVGSALPGGKVSLAGNIQKDWGIRIAQRDFICFVDDDTLLHPNLPLVLFNAEAEARIILFAQQRPADVFPYKEILTPVKGDIGVGKVDSGMLIASRDVLLSLGAPFMDTNQYTSDGMLISRLCELYPDEVQYMTTVASFYNKLR